jgi:capsular exopolysaccharide synthesis family protein
VIVPPEEISLDVPSSARNQTALQVAQPADVSRQLLAPGGAPPIDDALHFREIWHIVRKRKWTLIAFFLLVVVAVAIATTLQKPIYRSVISLKIERDQPKVVDFKDVTPTESSYDVDSYKTQYELLKSRTLAQRVVAQLNLRQNSALVKPVDAPWWRELIKSGSSALGKFGDVSWWKELIEPGSSENTQAYAQETTAHPDAATVDEFLGSLTVEPVRNSRLLKVYFTSPDRRLAADVLNALAQNFIDINLERRSETTSYANAFLEEKIAQTKARLEDAERRLVAFQRDQQIINIDERQNVLAQTLSDFNTAGSRAQQERLKAESLYQSFNAEPESSPQVLENKPIQTLKEQRARMQAEYQDLSTIYKPAFPKMQQLQAGIDELDKTIKEEVNIVRRSAEGSYKATLAQETSILARLEASKKAVLDLQSRSFQYNILKRDVETNRQFYDGLLQRYKEVGVAGGIGVNNISVVDPAEISSLPYKPNLRLNLLIAMVLGLGGGLGLVFFLEHLDDRLHRPEDLERTLHLPVLGVIPFVKRRKRGRADALGLDIQNESRSSFAEAYRSVRTALQFSTRDGAPTKFVVTSTASGDGKTTTALSLAIHFAQARRPVLLIDADLRNPSLHRSLGANNSRGLSNYLSSDIPVLAGIRTTPIQNLFLIPTGPLPPNPVELLSGPKFPAILAQLGKRFSHIIIDSPAVLGLADALVLGNQVGAVLYVVASGTTKKAHAMAALKRLRRAGITPIGAVMTKASLRDGMDGYESAYYYYGSTNAMPALPKA